MEQIPDSQPPKRKLSTRKKILGIGTTIMLALWFPIAIDQAYFRYNFWILPVLSFIAVIFYGGMLLTWNPVSARVRAFHTDYGAKHQWGYLLVVGTIGGTLLVLLGGGEWYAIRKSQEHVAALRNADSPKPISSPEPVPEPSTIPKEKKTTAPTLPTYSGSSVSQPSSGGVNVQQSTTGNNSQIPPKSTSRLEDEVYQLGHDISQMVARLRRFEMDESLNGISAATTDKMTSDWRNSCYKDAVDINDRLVSFGVHDDLLDRYLTRPESLTEFSQLKIVETHLSAAALPLYRSTGVVRPGIDGTGSKGLGVEHNEVINGNIQMRDSEKGKVNDNVVILPNNQ